MAVFFYNPGTVDPAALTTLGVNVKEGSAIGYFGTGFKFAVATLLRSGHTIEVRSDGNTYRFSTVSRSIRGQTFSIVTMNDRELGFTTDLGRDWKPWMAYRELHSNALDESGNTTDDPTILLDDSLTIVCVSGPDIDEAYEKRGEVFIESSPVFSGEHIRFHPGITDTFFYRGVKAYKNQGLSLYTYNLLIHQALTEDRTLYGSWSVENYAKSAIALECTDAGIIRDVICAPNSFWESKWDWSENEDCSDLFLSTVKECLNKQDFNHTLIKLYVRKTPGKSIYDGKVVTPNDWQVRLLDEAFDLLEVLGVEPFPILIIRDMESWGAYDKREDKILLALRTLDQPVRFIASTLFEEHIHRHFNLIDYTREFQDFLLNQLFLQVERQNND